MASRTLVALAAGSLSFAKVHAHDVQTLEETERSLDKQLDRENKGPPEGSVAKVRYHGERFLHSKHVLLVVVALNIIDCILVMGELILDIHYIVDVLEKSETLSNKFVSSMEHKYPYVVAEIPDLGHLYDDILSATIHWNFTHDHPGIFDTNETAEFISSMQGSSRRDKRAVYDAKGPIPTSQTTLHKPTAHHKYHSIEEDIAHGFHKASITILAILVLETACKIFCFGKHMLENKLEVFDSCIVFASFILDLVFIKGLTVYPIQEFVFILAFLVPWRVLRVVNSLIVAIIDHEHFRMKLLYKQKKQTSAELKEAKKDLKLYEKSVQSLESLCTSSGISQLKVRTCTVDLKNRKKKGLDTMVSLATMDSQNKSPLTNEDENKNGSVNFRMNPLDSDNGINNV